MIDKLGLVMLKEDEFKQIDNCQDFVDKLNLQLIEDSHSENEFSAQYIKIHDLIKLDDQLGRLQLDPMKFAIFLKEN